MKRKAVSLVSAPLVLTLALIASHTEPARAQGPSSTVATGLNGPMGVLAAPDGSVWVIDTGIGGDLELELAAPMTGEPAASSYGESARIVRILPDGTQTEVARLPSLYLGPGESMGGSRLAVLDGVLYATSGGWGADWGAEPLPGLARIVRIERGEAIELASTWDFETERNPDGQVLESNPFGLAAGPDGMLWVVDAAANDLLKIDPTTGRIDLVAVFGMVPSPIPNPSRGGVNATDAVPTGLAFDAQGNAYVSFLPGFPFVPGSAKVVKVAPDGTVSDHATGLTMLTDLRTGPDGRLYAVSLGRFTEQGPVPNSGAIIGVEPGTESEELVSGLSFPTSIDFNTDGDAYVAINGMGEPGAGAVVVYSGLAARSDP